MVGKWALSMLLASLTFSNAHSACTTTNFNHDRLFQTIERLSNSVENLKALQSTNKDDHGHAALAIQIVDRSVVEMANFLMLIDVRSELVSRPDQLAVDTVIDTSSKNLWKSSKQYADYLTVLAPHAVGFDVEIRDARDRLRSLNAMFSCASD